MTFPSFENGRWYALVGGLAAVLTLLATLQYQSSRQISDATTEQILTSLDGSLVNLRQGLEGELAPLCRELQQNETGLHGSSLPDYARQFEIWRREAAHPALVTELYVWQPATPKAGEFLRFNLQRNEFRPAEVPSDLTRLLQRLQDMTPKTDVAADFSSDPNVPRVGAPMPVWMVDENNLVLLHPTEGELEIAGGQGKRRSVAWILVALNLDVLRSHIIPELVQRSFGAQGQQSYEIAVILQNQNNRAVIYSSDPRFAGQGEVIPDASLNLFGPPMPVVRQEGGTASTSFTVGMHLPARDLGQAHAVRSQNTGPGQPDFEPFRIEPIHYASGNGGLEVIAKHRKGSVEAAVSSLYHRSLAFNFCVLVVLATMMGLVIVTSRRVRRLAQLQMDFVASVSHELRTPLAGIVAAAQNIADGVVGDKVRVARYGTAIVSQAQQLSELVEQILLFSATEKNRYRYHLQPASVEDLVDASLKSAAALVRSAGVTVERQIQRDLPPVMVDFKAFSQCLQNLIANAVKYGGEARWLGISASQQESAEHGEEIRIAVEDRGIGIEKDDLKHVFEPFYRSPSATAVQIHGSGLGLPLVKSITEAMGGRLTVETFPQKGSTFTVHLPVQITERDAVTSDRRSDVRFR